MEKLSAASIKEVNVGDSVQFQNSDNGQFISAQSAEQAVDNSKQILFDTVNELEGDLSKSDYLKYAEQLGLPEDYYDWHGNSAVKTFDKKQLIEDAARFKQDREQAGDREAETLHDERQAEYDQLLDGLSNDDIERKAE